MNGSFDTVPWQRPGHHLLSGTRRRNLSDLLVQPHGAVGQTASAPGKSGATRSTNRSSERRAAASGRLPKAKRQST